MLLNNAMNYPKPQVIAFDSTDSGTPQQMFCNICYSVTAGNTYYAILPTLSETGDMLYLINTTVNNTMAGVNIKQNADQYICAWGDKKTTVGTDGYVVIAGNRNYYWFSLMCIEANKGWIFAGYQTDPASSTPQNLSYF